MGVTTMIIHLTGDPSKGDLKRCFIPARRKMSWCAAVHHGESRFLVPLLAYVADGVTTLFSIKTWVRIASARSRAHAKTTLSTITFSNSAEMAPLASHFPGVLLPKLVYLLEHRCSTIVNTSLIKANKGKQHSIMTCLQDRLSVSPWNGDKSLLCCRAKSCGTG